MERSAVHTFLQKCSPTLRIFGVFHPFCVNKKLKTHLREHSRQSPVPKIRSCFLSEFSACRSVLPRFFFLLSGASFFFLSQKKEERCGKNMFKLYSLFPSYTDLISIQTHRQIKIWNRFYNFHKISVLHKSNTIQRGLTRRLTNLNYYANI